MEKLFDLMVAGFKYQTLCSQQAQDILQVTLLHLHTVKQFLTQSQVQHAVDIVEARVLSLYEKLTIGQWRLVRQTLCRFFQDRRIKVSPPPHMHMATHVCDAVLHYSDLG
ncbi:hypothetical protein ABBQ38_001670 [Trebouxia sp. C0009 RCD-2024]